MKRRPGFTLMEILIAMALTGMLTALALAPVVMTVRRVVTAQNGASGTLALERAASFMARELAGAVRIAKTSVIVHDHQAFGGDEDDTLIVMTASPSRQHLAAGSVVYKLEHEDSLREVQPGLYRWYFPGKRPEDIDDKELHGEDGQLVLPGVTVFSVEVPEETESLKEYAGGLPVGISIAMTRDSGEKSGETGGKDSFEDTFVFP